MRNLLSLSAVILCATFAFSGAAFAGYELVCEGDQQKVKLHEPVYVDCTRNEEIIDMLGRALVTLGESNVEQRLQNSCMKAFNDAQKFNDTYSNMSLRDFVESFFNPCNMALSYVR